MIILLLHGVKKTANFTAKLRKKKKIICSQMIIIANVSVGSATFLRPGSGSGYGKICGSMDPEKRGKLLTTFSFETPCLNR